jgi:hypothetical protein
LLEGQQQWYNILFLTHLQVVSSIATIELPRGEWLELITNLSVNANNEDSKVKMSSLETLGYICEELVRYLLS